MTLLPKWREVLRRAWSVRLIVIAALLSGFEVALPFLPLSIPDGIFAAMAVFVAAAAFAARLLAQKGLTDAD